MSNLRVRRGPLSGWIYWAALACLLISGAGAQDAPPMAMRAPLDVIPQPMRDAVGDGAGDRSARKAKVAPRVVARQTKRAVRSVAALPGSESRIVQVGQLGALEDASVGLEAGYGDALWRGARLAFVADLMKRLPPHHVLPRLREMERKLLRSATAAPTGAADGTSWSATRLNRLLMIGDTQSALALAALTDVARSDAYAARAKVLAHLAQGDRLAACAEPTPKRGTKGRRATQAFFLKLLVYCQLARGEFAKAALAVELNEKTLGDDPLFREVAFLLAAQAPVRLSTQDADPELEGAITLPAQMTALQLAVLQLTQQALPLQTESLPPYMVSRIIADDAQPANVQAAAALHGLQAGDTNTPGLMALAARRDFSAYQPNPLSASAPETMSDAVFVVTAVQRVAALPPAERAFEMARHLKEATQRGVWLEMVHGFAALLRSMELPTSEVTERDSAPFEAVDIVSDALALFDRVDLDFPLQAEPETAPLGAELAQQDRQEESVSAPRDPQPLSLQAKAMLMAASLILEAQDKTMALQALDGGAPDMARRLARMGADDFLPQERQLAGWDAPSDGPFNGLPDPENLPTGPIADWQAHQAKIDTLPKAVQTYLGLKLAVIHGLGFAVPESLTTRFGLIGESANIDRWVKLAEDKWIGDLILAITGAFASQPVTQWKNGDVSALLTALRAAGLSAEAQAIGRDLLAVHYARLLPRYSDHMSARDAPREAAPAGLQDGSNTGTPLRPAVPAGVSAQ